MELDWPETLQQSKLYYSIGDVAEALELQPSTLRFWEEEFKSLQPDNSPGGQRRYRQEDVETVLKIKHLLREEQFKIEGAKEKLRNWNNFHSPRKTVDTIKSICDETIDEIEDFLNSLK